MAALSRLVFGVIAASAAIAGAGCRQLFGIDDTHTQGDVDAGGDDVFDGAPDATQSGLCRTDHFLCADFDSPDTGLVRLPETSVIGTAVAEEQAASDAPSSPRILRTYAESASTTSGIVVGTSYLGGTLPSSRVSFEIKLAAAEPGQICDPLVFVMTWVMDMMPAGSITLTATDNKLALQVTASGMASQIMVSLERDRWVPITVTFDYQTGHVQLAAGAQGGLTSAPLGGLANLDAAVGIGVVASNDHGNCTADFDDVIIDRRP